MPIVSCYDETTATPALSLPAHEEFQYLRKLFTCLLSRHGSIRWLPCEVRRFGGALWNICHGKKASFRKIQEDILVQRAGTHQKQGRVRPLPRRVHGPVELAHIADRLAIDLLNEHFPFQPCGRGR